MQFSFSIQQKVYFILKRVVDIIFSIAGLICFILLFFIIKIVYVLNGDKDPIIYKHIRVGKNGKLFNMYKFRTMEIGADKDIDGLFKDSKIKKEWEDKQKLQDDPRITKAGKFFRNHSLDEIPQFINVLKGDMSIIGPRPLVEGELQSKGGSILYEAIKPGITGWWACNGRSEVSYEKRLELEYYYIKHCSLYLDVVCFFKTIYVMIFKKGAE